MTAYETYCQIRLLHARGLSFNQIGTELGIDPETAAKYAELATFPRRRTTKRASKLDPFKPAIVRWLERHAYSATQIYQRLCADEGYTGGFSIVKTYVRAVRPVRHPAFLSLAFAGVAVAAAPPRPTADSWTLIPPWPKSLSQATARQRPPAPCGR